MRNTKRGLELAIAKGWLELHESGTHVRLTEAAAAMFARSDLLGSVRLLWLLAPCFSRKTRIERPKGKRVLRCLHGGTCRDC
jgi:hypothetical protein